MINIRSNYMVLVLRLIFVLVIILLVFLTIRYFFGSADLDDCGEFEFFSTKCSGSGCDKIHDIQIQDFDFVPKELKISPGDCVRWINLDTAYHTATDDSGLYDSGNLYQNDCYLQKFQTPGQFSYHCIPHPYMTGKITVE